MKPGRNDPCPCGSGKKYKQCCLLGVQAQADDPRQLVWRRVRRALEGFPARMLRFIDAAYGAAALAEAWDEFMLWEGGPFDPEHDQIPVFMPWFFHHWSPDPQETDVTDAALHEVTPTQLLLRRKNKQLDPHLRQYLESRVATPFSFYEVLDTEPGRGLSLRDVFTGETCEVLERSASRILCAGDLTYALLADVEGLTLLEASSPIVIPPIRKIELIEMRGA